MSKRFLTTVATSILGFSSLIFAPMAAAGEYTVEINKTEILRLPGQASAVIIGNPQIADISVHSSDTLLINGRGYGETNIIVFDEFGQTVMNADIIVSPPRSRSGVRVNYVGVGQETYDCKPYCVPTPVLGDSNEFISQYQGDAIASTNAVATGTSITTSPQSVQAYIPPAQYEPQR